MFLSARKRTLIIESQTLFVGALEQYLALEPIIDVVCVAGAITELLVRSSRPDLVIIDIDAAGVDLGEAVKLSRTLSEHVRVCVLSMHYRADLAQSCFDAGIDGYVRKDVTPAEFRHSIRSIAEGERPVTPSAEVQPLGRHSSSGTSAPMEILSPREIEVVRLIAGGMSNKAIAVTLHVSEKTVKNHVSRILAKLNFTARTQAAIYALQSGLERRRRRRDPDMRALLVPMEVDA
jgi:two-component system, NarL family, response regulator LiaR